MISALTHYIQLQKKCVLQNCFLEKVNLLRTGLEEGTQNLRKLNE